MTELRWVYLTASDRNEALRLGRALVEERLAACVLRSPRNASLVMPWIKFWIKYAALAISRRVASSRAIACLVSQDNHLSGAQNGLTPHPIGTPF